MKLLVIGRSGQVARALAEMASTSVAVVALGRPDIDLTDGASLGDAIARTEPDLIVNAAAYTAVDKAESEEAAAFAINAEGAGKLAAAARRADVPVIHLSTDYVFDGTKASPYVEEDPTGPLGVYGRSKLAGEQALAAEQPAHIILRTAWVHGPYGANFVRTMLKLAATRPVIRVVDDQHGCPTYAPHLAAAIIRIARETMERGAAAPWGLYHAAGTGETTWRGLAEAAFAEAGRYGWPVPEVVPIPSADYPTAARRPANGRLDCSRLRSAFGVSLPHWREGVTECLRELAKSERPEHRESSA
ncbi:MAG: dTDP-4-dehydrorhamnose reductase [Parvibaculaceae bacterium]